MSDLSKDILWLANQLEDLRPALKIISISAIDKDSFFLNSAGSNSRQIIKEDIGEYRLEPILDIYKNEYLSHSEINALIKSSKINQAAGHASTEALIHASGLKLAEAKYVLHHHSIKLNKVLCSKLGSRAFKGHVFEDSVIICGKNPASVKFAESGYPLALAIYKELNSFYKIYFHLPKILLLENHGALVFAQNPAELIKITKTLELWAELIYAGYQLTGPNYLSLDSIMSIEAAQNQNK